MQNDIRRWIALVEGVTDTPSFHASIVEGRNWQDISDPADRWLAKYTYEGLDRWPSKQIIGVLLDRYPAMPGMIYRGMNFDTKEDYDAFVAQLPTLKTSGITSWTKHEKAAEQFAVTKPSYFLDLSVMQAYGKQQQEGERLSGYRGLILAMQIGDHEAIDVNLSKLGHESEVILPAGQYEVRIHRVIKRYQDDLSDSGRTVDAIIRDAKTEDELSDGLVRYVINHHGHTIATDTQRHIFTLLKPTGPLMARHELPQQIVGYGFCAGLDDLIRLMDTGVFRDPGIIREIRQIAARALRDVFKNLRQDFMKVEVSSLKAIARVARVAGMQDRLMQIARKVAGPVYNELNRGRSIKDRDELYDIQKHLMDVVSRISACTSR